MKSLFLGLALASGLAATAQTTPAPTFTSTCQNSGSGGTIYMGDRNQAFERQKRFCETRDLTMSAPKGQPLTVDGGNNGGITVRGWDGPGVRIRAKIQTWGASEQEAQAQAKAILITTTSNNLRAATPGNIQQGAVSFEVFVPRRTALALTTHNGGISLTGLQGAIDFHAQNGGVSLAELGGQVTGKTINGGLSIKLSGHQWEGSGLDVATINGGITWQIPANYSAQFFTSTNGGSIKTKLPVSKPKGQYHEVRANLGSGGQEVKAITNNGSVMIKQG